MISVTDKRQQRYDSAEHGSTLSFWFDKNACLEQIEAHLTGQYMAENFKYKIWLLKSSSENGKKTKIKFVLGAETNASNVHIFPRFYLNFLWWLALCMYSTSETVRFKFGRHVGRGK